MTEKEKLLKCYEKGYRIDKEGTICYKNNTRKGCIQYCNKIPYLKRSRLLFLFYLYFWKALIAQLVQSSWLLTRKSQVRTLVGAQNRSDALYRD